MSGVALTVCYKTTYVYNIAKMHSALIDCERKCLVIVIQTLQTWATSHEKQGHENITDNNLRAIA